MLERKLEEYLENGTALGLLLDPAERRVHLYRRGALAETLDRVDEVSCEPVLPGFRLQLQPVWNLGW